jgi:menaquinone-specific isochorismate synthase
MTLVSARDVLTQAMSVLVPRVHQAFADWENAPDSVRERGVRLEEPMPALDPFAWLLGQVIDEQILWSSRDERDIRAGVGCCHVLSGDPVERPDALFQAGQRVLQSFAGPAPRYFGGFAFSSGSVDEHPWPRLGRSRFWIPRLELCLRDGQGFLAINLFFQRHVEQSVEDILGQLGSVVLDAYRPGPLPAIVGRRDHPDRPGWEANVRAALDMVEAGVLDKIVLARKAVYMFTDTVVPCHLLSVLREVTSHCYHFLLQVPGGTAFMGTPPERLYRRQGRQIETEALAGTRPRDADPAKDEALSKELLESGKDRREQEIVRATLLRQLHMLCQSVQGDAEPRLLKLERKQHLLSQLSGTLKADVDDATLLACLHPTPAVGGAPRDIALREIPRLEPFSRGWYAAPVGWFSATDAEFAVAIRSGLVQERRVNIYSGAGIVAGSVPAEEWQEIEAKISDFVTVTRGRPH